MCALSLASSLDALHADDPSPLLLAEGFATCFEAAQDQAAVGLLPAAVDDAPLMEQSPQHQRALAKRLAQLGYFSAVDARAVAPRPAADPAPAPSPPVAAGVPTAAPTSALADAVRRFQTDAGLPADGWVGPRTWAALQELFTFETPFYAIGWFVGGEALPAVRRAAWLRLKAYAVLPDDAPFNAATLAAGWSRWVALVQRFPLVPRSGAPLDAKALTASGCELLLNHDWIVDQLASRPDRAQPAVHGAAEDEVRRFLKALMKVELWLSGYPVAPDGETALSREIVALHGPRAIRRREAAPTELSAALNDYLAEDGARGVRFARVTPKISGDGAFDAALPQLLARACASPGTPPPEVSPEELAREIANQRDPAGFWQKLKTTLAQLTNSLFDGVKRVWRWLKNAMGQALDWTGRQLVNLARAVWDYLSRAGRVVRAAFTAFVEGVEFLFNDDLPGSDPRSVVVGHERDFDFRVFVAADAPPAEVEPRLRRLDRTCHAWRIACRMLGLAITAARTAARAAAGGVLTLAVIVVALLRIYDDLRALGQDLADYMSLDHAVLPTPA